MSEKRGRSRVARSRSAGRTRAMSVSASKRSRNDEPNDVPATKGMHGGGSKIENRSADIGNVTMNFNSTGAWTLVNGIVQGNNWYERMGQVIVMKSIHICGFVRPTNSNAAESLWETGRMMLIYDRNAGGGASLTGVQPTLATVLQDQSTGGATGTTANSGLNMLGKDRFKVLRDWKFILSPLGIAGVAPAKGPVNAFAPQSKTFSVNEYIKLKDLETHYNGTTAAIGSITTGAVWLFCFIDTPTGENAYAFEASIRLRYGLQ